MRLWWGTFPPSYPHNSPVTISVTISERLWLIQDHPVSFMAKLEFEHMPFQSWTKVQSNQYTILIHKGKTKNANVEILLYVGFFTEVGNKWDFCLQSLSISILINIDNICWKTKCLHLHYWITTFLFYFRSINLIVICLKSTNSIVVNMM